MKRESNILLFATQGHGGNDEDRIQSLMSSQRYELFKFDKKHKVRMFFNLIRAIKNNRYPLVVMEGSGIAGGLALITSKLLFNQSFILSSGDNITGFLKSKYPLFAPIFFFYEFLLYRLSNGFIGWTPYLCGRALTFGAPKTVTVPGWGIKNSECKESKEDLKKKLELPQNKIIVGIVGSLNWNNKKGYCYGYELAKASKLVTNNQIHFLIVGGGTGLEKLKSICNKEKVSFTGQVKRSDLWKYYRVMDIGSLPQSLDQLGIYRYSTKLAEYFQFLVPIITGQLPMAYDIAYPFSWRIEGKYPWDDEYIQSLASVLNNISVSGLEEKKEKLKSYGLDKAGQHERFNSFIEDIKKERAA